jgi:NAD+ synthase (glutamine-hydrolysing)
MKLALSQLNFRIGDIELNSRKIRKAIEEAKAMDVDLVVFSELSVCGYPPADMLNFDSFVTACTEAIEQIAASCQGIAAIVGGPLFNTSGIGKRLFNAAFFLEHGRITQIAKKCLLPTYDVFDEYRYFEPTTQFQTIDFMGKRIALTICEDIWNLDTNRLYPISPMDELIKSSPDLMINISASPFAWNRGPERMAVLAGNSIKYHMPLVYVNQVGANTDLIFDGGSCVINSVGKLIVQMDPFIEGLTCLSFDDISSQQGMPVASEISPDVKYSLLRKSLVLGVRDYFMKSGLKRAILGLSGGIDSALTLVLAAEALGPENVWAILMPGPYSSDHSITDAIKLADNLSVGYDIIPINGVVQEIEKSLDQYFKELPVGIAEENLQARARAIILMGLSNKHGHVLLNTSNKSEMAVGYGTLYGDMCGGLSVLGDVYKTEVYSLARYINSDREIIPINTIIKPPSAELKPNQKDTDALPDYEILDPLLFRFIEQQQSPSQIMNSGYDEHLVTTVVNLVNNSEYKRKQAPPALRVSQKGFGSGRRMPIVGKPLTKQ